MASFGVPARCDVDVCVQEAVEEETGAGGAPCQHDANPSWDVSTEKLASSMAKLSKTESQTVMSPR